MTKKEEIEKEIWAIWQILLLAKECYSYSFYLNMPDSEEELQYLNYSTDFRFIRVIMWKMAVVELSKLFKGPDKGERYNVFNFIDKLKKGEYFGKMGISQTKINEWEKLMNENSETISKILTLRDKLYSHTDTNKEKHTKTDIDFEKTEKLIKIIESVIQEVFNSVLDSHASMETIFFKRERFKMIKILAEEKKNRINISKKGNPNSADL